MTPHRGFGLLEAIVAMALLAGTGLALFSWINQNLQEASRLRARERDAQLLMSAQTLIETVNPARMPQGKLELGELVVQWTAESVESPRANATFTEAVGGPWQVGLYRLQVHARDPGSGADLRFEQWRVGTHRLQAVSDLLK
jgi:general secretion pathway protein I